MRLNKLADIYCISIILTDRMLNVSCIIYMGTIDYSLTYSSENNNTQVVGYTDANIASCNDTRTQIAQDILYIHFTSLVYVHNITTLRPWT